MLLRRSEWVVGLLACAITLNAAQDPAPRPAPGTSQQPVFKSGVELIAVDVAIVDKNGHPIAGVTPEQFEVTVEGKPRRVVSAEFIEYTNRTALEAARPDVPMEERPGFSSNLVPAAVKPQGRLIYLAVDQASFRTFGERGAMEAARRFIDRLQPADRVGLVAFPPPGPLVPASRDHAAARSATGKISGRAMPFRAEGLDKNVSLGEAIDIRAGDALTLQRVLDRECPSSRGGDRQSCEILVLNTARNIGQNAEFQATQSLSGIEAVIRGLADIRERKTLVLVTAGLPVSDRSGKDLQLMSYVASLGRDAAVANLNLYVLHIDSGFLEAFSAENRTISDTLYRDLSIMRSGLETIAGASGGSLARVVAGADFAFERVLRETAAAYLIGVEPVEGDRDGKPHRISVKVRIPGAQVRSRSEFAMPKADATPATPEEALAAAYRSDRPQTAVPVRVATHVLAMGPDGRHRVLVSADIGANIESPAELRVLYAFVDNAGKAQPAVGQKVMLRPRAGGPPGSVSYTSENALPPGSYTLRFAVLDSQGRAGAVEHSVSAGLTARGDVLLSDLVLLEPVVLAGEDTYVCTDAELRSPAVDMYVEIVPAAERAVVTDVTFSVADTPGGEPLVSATAMLARPPGAVHWSATARLKLAELPPGNYIATAAVWSEGRSLGSMMRPIRIVRGPEPVRKADAGAPPTGRAGSGAADSPGA